MSGKTSWGASRIARSVQPPSLERMPGLECAWTSSPCKERLNFFLISRFLALLVLLGFRMLLAALAPAPFFLSAWVLHSVGHRVHFNEGLKG